MNHIVFFEGLLLVLLGACVLSLIASRFNLPDGVGMRSRHLPNEEKRRLDTFQRQDFKDLSGARRNRTVVKCDNHLMIIEGERLVILHRPDARMLEGIDRYGPAGAKRFWIARALGRLGRGCRRNH